MPRKCQNTPRSVRAAARRAEIAECVLSGMSQREIGQRLGVSRQAIAKQEARMIAEWQSSASSDTTLHLVKEIARLEAIDRALCAEWSARDAGARNVQLQATRVSVSERRCKLLRLDAYEPPLTIRIDPYREQLGAMTTAQLYAALGQGPPPPASDGVVIGGAPRDDSDGGAAVRPEPAPSSPVAPTLSPGDALAERLRRALARDEFSDAPKALQ